MRKIPPPYTDPTYLFRHGGAAPPGMLDFSASINPLGPPASVLAAMRDALPDIARYPDPDCRELVSRLAALHGVSPEQIVIGNGSNELIYAIARAFAPKRVAIAEPTYTEYLRASLAVGAQVDHWLATGFHFRVRPFNPGKADLVWLCNPNNPTGSVWPTAPHMARWMVRHPQTLFVVDEAFMPLCTEDFFGGQPITLIEGAVQTVFPGRVRLLTLIPLINNLSNLIVLRSLTKYYSLPGVRLGYAVTSGELARQIRGQLSPWSVNALAQVAGVTAVQDAAFHRDTVRWFRRTHDDLFGRIGGAAQHLARARYTWTIFMVMDFFKLTAAEVVGRLADRGIMVRDASNFVGLNERFIRVGLRTSADNRRLAKELASIRKEYPCPAP